MSKEGKPAPETEQDDVFSDNFDTDWGDKELDDTFTPEEEEAKSEEESDEEESKENAEADKKEKGDNSAIFQKKRYRELYKQSQEKIAELEKKVDEGKQLSVEEQKEKAAEEFLSKKIRDVLSQLDAEKQRAKLKQEEMFQAELEEVLDENENITEEQILKVTDELGVSPKQAVKIIERERKLVKRDKPNIPKERRAATKVESPKTEEKKSPRTLDSVNRRVKEMLGRGEL